MAGLTKLQAVNIMLGTIGEAPVSSLTSSGSATVAQAISILDEVLEQVQNEDWEFNIDMDYPLYPDVNGYVAIPSNVLSVDTSDKSASLDVSVRNDRLYDKYRHSFDFSDYSPVYVEIKWSFPFEELPQYVRHYCSIRAARVFVKRHLADGDIMDFTTEDELRARAIAKSQDARNADRVMLDPNSRIGRINYRRIR